MLDPELLSGLEEAVEAAPENRKLHLHLIALLLSGGLSDRALGHAQWLLLHEPDNEDALLLAAQAAARSKTTNAPTATAASPMRWP